MLTRNPNDVEDYANEIFHVTTLISTISTKLYMLFICNEYKPVGVQTGVKEAGVIPGCLVRLLVSGRQEGLSVHELRRGMSLSDQCKI